jgi:hypothetical protein
LTTKCLNVDSNPYCEECGRLAFAARKKAKLSSPSKTENMEVDNSEQKQTEEPKQQVNTILESEINIFRKKESKRFFSNILEN